MKIYVLMGVAGCGKSTVAREAAKRLNIPFLEGDDFHPKSNVEKMSGGTPLTDEDRMPWIDLMVQACKNVAPNPDGKTTPIIVTCSALSKTVRQRLRSGLNDQCQFIHLHGNQAMIEKRLAARKSHFMKTDLLTSQLATLEVPERAIRLDISQPVDVLAQQVCDIIQSEN